jgi:tetratricopeptide (TPR) repeat protein
MTFLYNLAGMFAFRMHALRALAERRALIGSMVCFVVGFGAYDGVRGSINVRMPELFYQQASPLWYFFNISRDLIQVLLFLMLIYIPALIILGNAISGDGMGFSISKQEYHAHISVFLPLWGMLYLIAAPLQWFSPSFLEYPQIDISIIGMLVPLILILTYTLWAIQKLNYLSLAQALGVFALSWFALPVYILFTLVTLPLFFMIPLIYLGSQWIRSHLVSQTNERAFQKNLHISTINPQDADAQYQLGLIHLKRRNLDAARKCFEKSIEIDPLDPDFHYSLGQAFELKEEWGHALVQYEETYRLNAEYRLGDIFREVGKGYLNTGSIEKGIEFLNFFLAKRGSDPEGRYWLAIALQKSGDTEQMRFQLHTIIQQARSNPGFFRKENREWIYRARMMIRNSL